MRTKSKKNDVVKQEHGFGVEAVNDATTTIVKELMIEDTTGYKEMMRMNHGNFCEILGMIEPYITPKSIKFPMDTLGTARARAQHVERCCANGLDFVEPHVDDRETKEMLSETFDQFQI